MGCKSPLPYIHLLVYDLLRTSQGNPVGNLHRDSQLGIRVQRVIEQKEKEVYSVQPVFRTLKLPNTNLRLCLRGGKQEIGIMASLAKALPRLLDGLDPPHINNQEALNWSVKFGLEKTAYCMAPVCG